MRRQSDPLAGFGAATRAWVDDAFAAPTAVQACGWPVIASGRHALLVAPTGSGKTLAAFLWAIDRTLAEPARTAPGVRVLYVSPLKALVHDVERNLRAPLAGIAHAGARVGTPVREVSVAMRTGDTPQRERAAFARRPTEILVTTPESLYLMLGSRARAALATVHTVIVDEVHALAPTKRGVHLALSLERLCELTRAVQGTAEPQRIGLSATVRPTATVAEYLGGDRPVEVVDCAERPRLDLLVTVPVPDMERPATPPPGASPPPRSPVPERGGSILAELHARDATPPPERGIWPAVYPRLLEMILERRSTIVFVNSRGLAERLAQRLNELAGEDLVRAHHGSVSHAKRTEIEEALKAGALRAIVATSSLELGIDMGAVDQVLLVESPGSVARGLQRVGRSGHAVGERSLGRIFPKFRGDLLESAVIARRMLDGDIEALSMPHNALDVLAQQVVAMVCDRPREVSEVAALVRRSAPYRTLSDDALTATLDMLSGVYPSTDLADLRPRITWDRTTDRLQARRGTELVARTNAGTIPDRGHYAVVLGADGPRVGELDEEMVFETRLGDCFALGASTWRVEAIERDRVVVSPAPGEPGRLPFWRGDGPGRPVELGRAIGALTRRIGAMDEAGAAEWLVADTPLDAFAARNLAAYVHDQKRHTGHLPTDRAVTVERFRDELGDWRVCILSPFGARVHAPWAMALERLLGTRAGYEVQLMYTDDGIVLRLADVEELPPLDALLPDPDEVEELVTEQLGDTALFSGLFRENAVRALLMPRRRPGERNPLWAQRQKARHLLASARRHASFPVVVETYRQALGDVLDVPALVALLRAARSREIDVHEVETPSASPFARSLVFAYVAAYIYEQDSPIAERRAQALTLDRGLLAELLGQAELRELLDGDVVVEVEAELTGTAPERRAEDADALHDLLRRVGDLRADECVQRAAGDAAAWLQTLADARRAVEVRVGGERRWVAAQDAGLYRDALGVVPPGGLPDGFLAPVPDAFAALVRRYARSHGPFTSAELAARYRLQPSQVTPVLSALEASGALTRGELRPGGSTPEWCDVAILRRIKRRTVARLRNAAAPVEASVLGTFLPEWHAVDAPTRGSAGAHLEAALARLEGLPLPWSALAGEILPRRAAEASHDALDLLAASGRVVWLGCGALGTSDGRIAVYRREHVALLAPPPAPWEPPSAVHVAILDHLARRGASFLFELEDAAARALPGLERAEFERCLWDLVWAGRITNDTFAPLRGLGRAARRRSGRYAAGIAGGRWSSVDDLLGRNSASETERAHARARMLLERYAVVSREAALAEELPGGWTALQPVLAAMDDAGQVRRGYWVAGLSGAQYAQPGTIDRMRGHRGDDDRGDAPSLLVLTAIDPANPWGSLLPWPETTQADSRPRRVAGAWVALVDGTPLLWLGAGGRQLVTFRESDERRVALVPAALRALVAARRRRGRSAVVIERIDGEPADASALTASLLAAGWVRDYRGLGLAS